MEKRDTAVGYLRTSSAANVSKDQRRDATDRPIGEDKDSHQRQIAAIDAYAEAHGYQIDRWFYDKSVKGSESIENRPDFAEMMSYMASSPAKTILVETASRFSRDLIVQETGYALLKRLGYALVAVDDPDAFTSDTPTAILVRQILGAVSQFEKASLVMKLAGARQRKRIQTGRCEGRKPAPDDARTAARLWRSHGASLRLIALRLASSGFLAPSGQPYGPSSVRCMLATQV